MELKYNTEQVLVIGPIVSSSVKLIRSDESIINISPSYRTWIPVQDCSGFYFVTLLSSDLNILGYVSIWPTGQIFSIISENIWDSKYDSKLLLTETQAQKG